MNRAQHRSRTRSRDTDRDEHYETHRHQARDRDRHRHRARDRDRARDVERDGRDSHSHSHSHPSRTSHHHVPDHEQATYRSRSRSRSPHHYDRRYHRELEQQRHRHPDRARETDSFHHFHSQLTSVAATEHSNNLSWNSYSITSSNTFSTPTPIMNNEDVIIEPYMIDRKPDINNLRHEQFYNYPQSSSRAQANVRSPSIPTATSIPFQSEAFPPPPLSSSHFSSHSSPVHSNAYYDLNLSIYANYSALFETYCSKYLKVKPEYSFPERPPGFECECSVDGEVRGVGRATTKKGAKNAACQQAMHFYDPSLILPSDTTTILTPTPAFSSSLYPSSAVPTSSLSTPSTSAIVLSSEQYEKLRIDDSSGILGNLLSVTGHQHLTPIQLWEQYKCILGEQATRVESERKEAIMKQSLHVDRLYAAQYCHQLLFQYLFPELTFYSELCATINELTGHLDKQHAPTHPDAHVSISQLSSPSQSNMSSNTAESDLFPSASSSSSGPSGPSIAVLNAVDQIVQQVRELSQSPKAREYVDQFRHLAQPYDWPIDIHNIQNTCSTQNSQHNVHVHVHVQ